MNSKKQTNEYDFEYINEELNNIVKDLQNE